MKITNICTNCQVITMGNTFTIFSYGTPVYRVIRGEHGEALPGTGRLWSGWSATTQRHINKSADFIGGMAKMTKAIWDKLPVID